MKGKENVDLTRLSTPDANGVTRNGPNWKVRVSHYRHSSRIELSKNKTNLHGKFLTAK